MVLSEGSVRKVVKARVCSMAIHPSQSTILVAAGDKLGHVGLWNVVSGWCAPHLSRCVVQDSCGLSGSCECFGFFPFLGIIPGGCQE